MQAFYEVKTNYKDTKHTDFWFCNYNHLKYYTIKVCSLLVISPSRLQHLVIIVI